MPEDKINSANPEENETPKKIPETESQSPGEEKGEITEPTMDNSASLTDGLSTDENSNDSDSGGNDELSEDEIDKALKAANGTDLPATEPADDLAENAFQDDDINVVKTKEFEDFTKAEPNLEGHNIDMLLDVTLPISIELGRTSMAIEDILNLGPGSVVELNRLAGEPVDLLVNDKLIAKGEVVVVDENFGIRVTNMVSQEERLKSLI